ncbi:hypothetical protein PVAP13_9KG482300 [Panicum virgatum]|uniref:Uncharacterized protein n=1 Tax=Panicum virgatum TaxID=38727 RepID=A0A8T0NW84_PANVG|nr:hypothetical protein PVAP13_9KG482300 [Panicum virgatum]
MLEIHERIRIQRRRIQRRARPCSPAANDADPGSSHADPSSSELADSRSPASRRPPRPLPARRRGPASRLPVHPTLLPSAATAPALRAGCRCARTGHARPPPLPSSALLPAPRCSLQQRGKRVEGPVVEDGKGWGRWWNLHAASARLPAWPARLRRCSCLKPWTGRNRGKGPSGGREGERKGKERD